MRLSAGPRVGDSFPHIAIVRTGRARTSACVANHSCGPGACRGSDMGESARPHPHDRVRSELPIVAEATTVPDHSVNTNGVVGALDPRRMLPSDSGQAGPEPASGSTSLPQRMQSSSGPVRRRRICRASLWLLAFAGDRSPCRRLAGALGGQPRSVRTANRPPSVGGSRRRRRNAGVWSVALRGETRRSKRPAGGRRSPGDHRCAPCSARRAGCQVRARPPGPAMQSKRAEWVGQGPIARHTEAPPRDRRETTSDRGRSAGLGGRVRLRG
jgi:hypothetical protein